MWAAEEAFYDFESETRELARHVAEIQKLKDEQDALIAEQEAKYNEEAREAKDNYPALVDAVFSAKADFEEARVFPGTDQEVIDHLRHEFDEAFNVAESARWMVYDFKSAEERKKADVEDMAVVRQARETYITGMETALLEWKTPLDTQIALVAEKKTLFEAAQATEAAAQTALDAANTAWAGRDQGQDGTDANNAL